MTKSAHDPDEKIDRIGIDHDEVPFDVTSILVKSFEPSHGEDVQEREAESTDFVESNPFEVYLRYEEDIAAAYRDFYRDQVVNDKRNELGRFLFGVSFTTLGFIVSVLTLSKPEFDVKSLLGTWLLGASVFLILSALCSLRLAIPKNQDVNPTTLELVELHRKNSTELSRFSFLWFFLWLIGFILGVYVLIK